MDFVRWHCCWSRGKNLHPRLDKTHSGKDRRNIQDTRCGSWLCLGMSHLKKKKCTWKKKKWKFSSVRISFSDSSQVSGDLWGLLLAQKNKKKKERKISGRMNTKHLNTRLIGKQSARLFFGPAGKIRRSNIGHKHLQAYIFTLHLPALFASIIGICTESGWAGLVQ